MKIYCRKCAAIVAGGRSLPPGKAWSHMIACSPPALTSNTIDHHTISSHTYRISYSSPKPIPFTFSIAGCTQLSISSGHIFKGKRSWSGVVLVFKRLGDIFLTLTIFLHIENDAGNCIGQSLRIMTKARKIIPRINPTGDDSLFPAIMVEFELGCLQMILASSHIKVSLQLQR